MSTWRVLVRGEWFYVEAIDVDSARTIGMMQAISSRDWKLRDVFCATPTDQIRCLNV